MAKDFWIFEMREGGFNLWKIRIFRLLNFFANYRKKSKVTFLTAFFIIINLSNNYIWGPHILPETGDGGAVIVEALRIHWKWFHCWMFCSYYNVCFTADGCREISLDIVILSRCNDKSWKRNGFMTCLAKSSYQKTYFWSENCYNIIYFNYIICCLRSVSAINIFWNEIE